MAIDAARESDDTKQYERDAAKAGQEDVVNERGTETGKRSQLDCHSLLVEGLLVFGATFAGVLLAQSLSERARVSEDIAAYRSLVAVMAADCERNVALNEKVDPASEDRNLRPTVFLFSAALQNSLLFRHMEAGTLAQLIDSMAETAQSVALYNTLMNTPRIAFPLPQGPQDEPQPGETRAAYQQRMLAKGRADLVAEALPVLRRIGSQQATLCMLLRAEERRVAPSR